MLEVGFGGNVTVSWFLVVVPWFKVVKVIVNIITFILILYTQIDDKHKTHTVYFVKLIFFMCYILPHIYYIFCNLYDLYFFVWYVCYIIPSLLSISLIYGCIPSMAFIFLAKDPFLGRRTFWVFDLLRSGRRYCS